MLGFPSYDGYLDRVREDLAIEFPTGEFQVRTESACSEANYLEFIEHTRAVMRRLVYHARGCSDSDIDRDSVHWQTKNFKFVCVGLDTECFSVLDGSTPNPREILFARENGNNFLPLRPSRAFMQRLTSELSVHGAFVSLRIAEATSLRRTYHERAS